jgi:hypothetical protein
MNGPLATRPPRRRRGGGSHRLWWWPACAAPLVLLLATCDHDADFARLADRDLVQRVNLPTG